MCRLRKDDKLYFIALMMEAASTSETSVKFYQTTRRNNSEDSHLHTRRRENLKSQKNSNTVPETTEIFIISCDNFSYPLLIEIRALLIQPLCNIFTSAAKMLLQYWEQVVISR
jgi:hypothetical protein